MERKVENNAIKALEKEQCQSKSHYISSKKGSLANGTDHVCISQRPYHKLLLV